MAVSMTSLTRAPNGDWFARKVIPAAVREAYRAAHGVSAEVRFRRPGSMPMAGAKQEFRDWDAEVTGRIERLRAMAGGTGLALTRREAHALAGEWYLWFIARHEDEPGSAEGWDLLVEALESAYMRYGDEVPDDHPSVRRHVRAQLSGFACIPTFLAERDVVLAAEGVNRFLDTVEVEFKSACGALRRRSEGNYRPDERAQEFPVFAAKAVVGAPPAGFTCLELFRAWVAERQPAPATTNRWRSVFIALEREFPKRDVATITETEARAWRDTLVTDARSARVVNGTWLRSAKLVFAWAHADKKISTDPFAGVALVATKAAPPKLRERDFNDGEWQTILADTLRPVPKRMATHNAASRRWVPWLCAYSGARAGEMTQLRAEDVKQHTAGFWTMRITPEAGTVKGGQARVVPIHDHVVEQGFIEFVTAKGGKGPLFYDPHGGRVSTAVRDVDNPLRGEWIKARAKLAEWVRDLGIDDPNISPTHAWRHTFKRRAARAQVDRRIRWAMCGHSSRDVGDAYETPSIEDLYRELLASFPRYELQEAGARED